MSIQLTRRDAKHSYVKGKRFHVTPIGELPGVTTVLDATNNYDFTKWRKDNPDESKRCLERGIQLHDSIELYFSFQNETANYLIANKLFDKLYGDILKEIKPVVWEHQVYSKLGFSGSLDCLGYYKGKLTLFDWKTSTKTKTSSQVTNYLIQVSAYAYALSELDGVSVDQCAVVIIPEQYEKCQLFKIQSGDIDLYFAEFKKRLRWFQSQSQTAIAS